MTSRVSAELACAAEALRIARRGRWYAGVLMLLYARSAMSWRRMRPLRMGFCYLQRIDDMLDGDLRLTDPAHAACAELAWWSRSSGEERDARTATLGTALRAAIEPLDVAGEAPAAVRRVIATMVRDHARRVNRSLLDERGIERQLRATFVPSLDLLLIAAGSTLRSSHVPSTVMALGATSVVRDLDEDLGAGLVNVPAPLVAMTDGHPNLGDGARAWLDQLASRGRAAAIAARAELAAAPTRDRGGERVVGMLLHGCERRLADS